MSSAVSLPASGPVPPAAPPLSSPLTATPHAALEDVPDVPGLPRVLLLGDSISYGYTQSVRAQLEGRANVHRRGQGRFNSGYALEHLDEWLGPEKWTVIHFNYGLWDIKFVDEKGKDGTVKKDRRIASVEEYESNLREIARQLKRTGAKLIFATSTPVPAGTRSRVKDSELPINDVAVRVMKESGIPIDDLHAYIRPHQFEFQLPHDVHFTPAGYKELAKAVVASITTELGMAPR